MSKTIDQRLARLEAKAVRPRLVKHYLQKTETGWLYDWQRVSDSEVQRLSEILPVWVRPLDSWGTMFLADGTTIGPDEIERIVELV